MWCHWSFLSLTCHQLASLGNIFNSRVVHVLYTLHPATKAVFVSSIPVCSDRPATMMTTSSRRGRAACEPTMTRRQKEQPAVYMSLLLPHQTSEPISSCTASHHQPGCFSLFAFHAEYIPWMYVAYILLYNIYSQISVAINLLELSAVDLNLPQRNYDSSGPKQTWWDVIWGAEVEELGYDQPPWRQRSLFIGSQDTHCPFLPTHPTPSPHRTSCLVVGLYFHSLKNMASPFREKRKIRQRY